MGEPWFPEANQVRKFSSDFFGSGSLVSFAWYIFSVRDSRFVVRESVREPRLLVRLNYIKFTFPI